jgi:hypothetical protein
VTNTVRFFIGGSDVEAIQAEGDPSTIYLLNLVKGKNNLTVTAASQGKSISKDVTISTKVLRIKIEGGELRVEEAAGFPGMSIYGDLNGDGVTDSKDLELLVGYIADGTFRPEADLNGDGQLDIADVIKMMSL